MLYTLLIDSTRGPAGQVVDIDPSEAETIAILTRNGIIGETVQAQKVSAPEITKVTAPEVKKRKAKAHDASDTAD
jgi:hypothetical protein